MEMGKDSSRKEATSGYCRVKSLDVIVDEERDERVEDIRVY